MYEFVRSFNSVKESDQKSRIVSYLPSSISVEMSEVSPIEKIAFVTIVAVITFAAGWFSARKFSVTSSSQTPAAVEFDDDCNTLLYDPTPDNDGKGFPEVGTITHSTIDRMKTVHAEYKKLPLEFYKVAVEALPLVCVDVVCKRLVDGKLLLFLRRDKPAANIWWWPGGRMFKGETFFDTAVRKVRDETGNLHATVNPIKILNVVNTMFPDSSWDVGRQPGREGTQTVNICVYCELLNDDVSLQASAEDWAVEARKWVSAAEAVVPGAYDKYVSLNVRTAQQLKLL